MSHYHDRELFKNKFTCNNYPIYLLNYFKHISELNHLIQISMIPFKK